MADGNRYKALEEQIKRTELKMQEMSSEWRKQSDDKENSMEALMDLKIYHLASRLDSKIDAYAASIESKLFGIYNFLSKEMLRNLDTEGSEARPPLLPTPTSEPQTVLGENSTVTEKWGKTTFSHHWGYPKLELQVFTGENPREWLRKCTKFLELHQLSDSERMEAVELYLDGRADVWYQSFKMLKGKVSWPEFSEALLRRFGDRTGRDEIEEFNKLQQSGSVQNY